MKLEVSLLQLAEWLIHGIAVIIALLQVDSVNDRTLWPIPRAFRKWERTRNIQEAASIFLGHTTPRLAPPNTVTLGLVRAGGRTRRDGLQFPLASRNHRT